MFSYFKYNLSLLPLEVMASGSVAVCSKGANSEWLVNEDNSILVSYDPIEIADTMYSYMIDSIKLDKYKKKGIEFAQNTSWDVEGKKVLEAVLKGIKEDEKCINNRGNGFIGTNLARYLSKDFKVYSF
ncbi:MAG: hypothetical protein ACLTTH_16400 [Holdemanella porci]